MNFHAFLGGSPYNVGAHFLKIGANGELPLAIEDMPLELTEVMAYPNPGKDYLNISVSESQNQAKVLLYNLSGSLVSEQSFSGFDTEINTSHLPQGTYLYRVVSNRQEMLYSGKWIKQ